MWWVSWFKDGCLQSALGINSQYKKILEWPNILLLRGSIVQSGPERSRQSNLAVFTEEGGLDSKFPYVK